MDTTDCFEEYFPEEFRTVCVLVGVATVCMLLFTLLKLLFQLANDHMISKFRQRKLKYSGQWAVVTGGSSGIGKAYAFRLAKQGMDIFLISNELEALKTTVTEIEEQYRVRCCFAHVDFTDKDGVYEELEKMLKNKNIGILINCAGVLGNLPCKFLDETEKNMLNMISLHIKAVVQMTRIILPSMLTKKRGIVVNVSSMSSLLPFPYFNAYSACKAFSNRFSRALSYEFSDHVHVQAVIPYFVLTRMIERFQHMLPIRGGIISAEELVKNAMRTLTFTDYTTGYWKNDIMRWFVENLVPDILRSLILRRTFPDV